MMKALALSAAGGLNLRRRYLIFAVIAAVFLAGLFLWGVTMPESAYAVNYGQKNLAPSISHLFGTDYMGRDMFARSVKSDSARRSSARVLRCCSARCPPPLEGKWIRLSFGSWISAWGFRTSF